MRVTKRFNIEFRLTMFMVHEQHVPYRLFLDLSIPKYQRIIKNNNKKMETDISTHLQFSK